MVMYLYRRRVTNCDRIFSKVLSSTCPFTDNIELGSCILFAAIESNIDSKIVSSEKSTRTRSKQPAKKSGARSVRKKPYGEKHIIGFLFSISLLLTLFIAVQLGAMVALRIPDIRTVSHYRPLQTSYILDRNGNVVERIFKENRTVVALENMPTLLPKAFVAAEDGRFYEHPGLDFFSVLRAVIVNLKRGGRAHGGSTITQQVARSLLLTREKTYLRKFKEAILAWRIDSLLSKDDILFIYLNQIYLGSGAYGVEAASLTYFNKHVSQLSLGEMAVLAGLPQAPSRYSPHTNIDLAVKRQRYVLNRMAADGYIQPEQARAAFEAGVSVYASEREEPIDTGYYTAIVRKRAQRLLGNSLVKAGVTIRTHLDTDMQEAAVKAVRSGTMAVFGRQARIRQDNNAMPQGALVSIDTCGGEVRALVGGTDYAKSSFDRAAIAKRPAGSAFKPVIFAAALEKGWKEASLILDAPLSISGGGGKRWNPKNYSGKYYGETTLADALAHSYNTAAVRLLQKVGLNSVHQLSREMGIRSEMPGDLSLALGSIDLSLLELTGAYTPFICGGSYAPPQFIKTIEKDGLTLIDNFGAQKKKVISVKTAAQMKHMLQGVVSFGTGKRAQGLKGESGGKTGTSDDLRDAWFIGYNNSNITGVWVGHDHNESLGEGENGSRTPTPIWYDFMSSTVKYR